MHFTPVKPQIGPSKTNQAHTCFATEYMQGSPMVDSHTHGLTPDCWGTAPAGSAMVSCSAESCLKQKVRSWLASCNENSTGQLPHRHIRPDFPPCHHSRCVGGDAALSKSSLAADGQHSLQA